GFIYIIQPALLDAIKIGKTGRSVKERVVTYVTSYGRSMIITYFASVDIHKQEKLIHDAMKKYHIDCELYQKDSYDKAVEVCKMITNSELQWYAYKIKPLQNDTTIL